ncbi:hypothetical protein GQX73_g5819 [Xylaria multiplex]|uniref:Receptor L-domain domain-containing protein n=1 Tax=Xylaria multiplex TaxID=323545 RepID=A0A7C8INQ6_9PEZI|nr:hypothetical protein GQX73_g5819 [Xylaria multiplex]
MSSADCPDPLVFTSQLEIDNTSDFILTCVIASGLSIVNAVGQLNFTSNAWMSITMLNSISVFDSPQLGLLNFPSLNGSPLITISHAPSLKTVLFPNIRFDTVGDIPSSLNITDTPALQTLYLGDYLDTFTMVDAGYPSIDHITSIVTLEVVNQCPIFSTLSWAFIIRVSSCSPSFYSLESVGELSLRDIEEVVLGPQLVVNNSLTIDNSHKITPYPEDYRSDLETILTIGSNATMISNSGLVLGFSGLITLGDTLSVINNTNCSLNFEALTKARALVLVDNVDTTLPVFPSLERVTDVHLRGNVITSSGPNIFPSLKLASGTVTVEAWNNFNCSKLVSQQREGIINSLICNGTNNGTDINVGNSNGNNNGTDRIAGPGSSNSLSAGAWAGIAIGIAAIVLGGGAAIAWLILRFRRNLNDIREQLERNTEDASKKPETLPVEGLDHLHETDAQKIMGELPDEHVREMDVPHQACELQLAPQELPGNSPDSRTVAIQNGR